MSHSRTQSLPPQNAIKQSIAKPFVACSLILFLASLVLDVKGVKTLLNHSVAFASSSEAQPVATRLAEECTTEVVAEAQLSRKQLLEILAVPERDTKSRIRQIAPTPYCQLSSISIRAGAEATREAYPLAFDPETTLVILYEDEEYAGYRFKH